MLGREKRTSRAQLRGLKIDLQYTRMAVHLQVLLVGTKGKGVEKKPTDESSACSLRIQK